MPAILARGEQNDTSNDKLVFYGITRGPEDYRAGRLQDPFALDYEVVDISSDAKQSNPSVIVARVAVNLVTDKVGTGRFSPDFTLAADEPIGRHAIRFFYTLNDGDAERSDQCEFDVVEGLASFTRAPFYATPSDLKDEGVCGRTDAFLLKRLALASRYVERFTNRFFEPRYLEVNIDGDGGPKLLLQDPIVAVQDIAYEASPYLPSNTLVDDDLLRIYSRHLSQGLFQPDDRNNPKIELFHFSDDITQASPRIFNRLIFPKGEQNIVVKGVFGFTEPNSASCGGTPLLITQATMLLAMRNLAKLAELEKREDNLKRFRLIEERTRDQSYKLQPLGGSGLGMRVAANLTGDPEIDTILASFTRPPRLGAA